MSTRVKQILQVLALLSGFCSGTSAEASVILYDSVFSTAVRSRSGLGVFETAISDDPIGLEMIGGYDGTPAREPANGIGKAFAGHDLQGVLRTYTWLDVGPAYGYGATGAVSLYSIAYWRDFVVVDNPDYRAPLRLEFTVHALLDVFDHAQSSIAVHGGEIWRPIVSPEVAALYPDRGVDDIWETTYAQGVGVYYYDRRLEIDRHSYGLIVADDILVGDYVPFGSLKEVEMHLHMDLPADYFNPGVYRFGIGLKSEVTANLVGGGTGVSDALSTFSFIGATNPLTGEAVPITFGSGITSAPSNGPVVLEPTSLALAGFAGLGLVARAFRRRGRAGAPLM